MNPTTRGPSPRAVLVLLSALMAIDFADRQVLVAAFPYLRQEWGLGDTALGGLVSAVTLTVALGALPAARLVDRWSRVRAIALMGSTWSVAAAASGFAQSYPALLAARIGVGAGEAGYGPAGGALLATIFPAGRRATVLGMFQAAAPLGTVAGAALGSAIAAEWGWRWAVGILAVPGLVLALLVVRVRDYPTARRLPRAARTAVAALLRTRSAAGAVAGVALLLVVASTLYTWLPTHFERALGLAPATAGGLTAAVLLAGVAGTAGAAVLADQLARRHSRARLTIPAIAALLTAGLLGTAFGAAPPGGLQLLLILAGATVVTAAVGPAAAVVVDVMPAGTRATAVSLLVVAQNLFGMAVGPVLTGFLAEQFGLTTALTAVPALGIAAYAAFRVAARSYPADRAAALIAADHPDPDRADPAPDHSVGQGR